MHPSQACIPRLMNILGRATVDLTSKERDQQAIVLKQTAFAVRELASKLRNDPNQIGAEAFAGRDLFMKALEMVSKVTVAHNSAREQGLSETEIESAVAEALDRCAEALEAEAEKLEADNIAANGMV
jgi:hypothetical protein